MCVRKKLLCTRFNGPDLLFSRGLPSEAVIHPTEIYVRCPYERKDTYRDATFMIGSVTKLTLYAMLLAAAHKDEVEKREGL